MSGHFRDCTVATGDTVSDSRARAHWVKFLTDHYTEYSPEERAKFHGFKKCGSRIVTNPGSTPGVFLIRTEYANKRTDSHLFGVAHCHSPWACPYCTARVMAAKSNRIAFALEALESQKQSAIMVTLTLPHLAFMSAEETFTILRNAWRRFVARGRYKTKQTVKLASGQYATYKKGNDVFQKFRTTMGIEHSVRVYEFTHGRNGWHPHIHALFWIPNENFMSACDYEKELAERWTACTRGETVKYWRNVYKYDDATIEKMFDELFGTKKYRGFCISKDGNGKPRKINSSLYLSGWTGNKELTRTDLKRAREGHLTPHQILNEAEKATSAEDRDKWFRLFTEYALATRNHRRVELSKRLNRIIDAWLAEHPQSVFDFKKKATGLEVVGRQVVCWFTAEQWWSISTYLAKYDPDSVDIIPQILEKARLPDPLKEVTALLLEKNIDIRQNGEHPAIDAIKQIYNIA